MSRNEPCSTYGIVSAVFVSSKREADNDYLGCENRDLTFLLFSFLPFPTWKAKMQKRLNGSSEQCCNEGGGSIKK